MINDDLERLIAFAKENNMMNNPFVNVYEAWLKDLYEDYMWSQADNTEVVYYS